MSLDIRPVTPASFGDLDALFCERGPRGGSPTYGWCWCTYFRFRGRSWSNSTAGGNRAALETLTARDPKAHPPPGLVAYRDGQAAGWTSLGPRDDYERLAYSKLLAPVDDRPVWSIVCFVVSRRARGRGIATALLEAAIAHARHHGATVLEAYPVDVGDGRIPSANAYHGTLSMFRQAGFETVAVRRWNDASPERPIVRLELEPG